jgi:hypothetical protein
VAEELDFFDDAAAWIWRRMGGKFLFIVTRKGKKRKTFTLKLLWQRNQYDGNDPESHAKWWVLPENCLIIPEGAFYICSRSKSDFDVVLLDKNDYEILWMNNVPWKSIKFGDSGEGYHDCSCQSIRGHITWGVTDFY